MINYEWSITTLKTLDIDEYNDVIIVVHYELLGTDGNKTAREYGSFRLEQPKDTFIEFENITKENVIEWIETQYTDEIIELKNNISKKISRPEIKTHIVNW